MLLHEYIDLQEIFSFTNTGLKRTAARRRNVAKINSSIIFHALGSLHQRNDHLTNCIEFNMKMSAQMTIKY